MENSFSIENILKFRNQDEKEILYLPEIAENRKRTNSIWLYIMIAAIVICCPYIIYKVIYSDLRRIFTYYDKCGNLCGYENEKILNLNCSGQSMVNKPYIYMHKKECVESCNDYKFDCKKANYRFDVLHLWDQKEADSFYELWKLIFPIINTIVLTYLAYVFLKYCPFCFVWSVVTLLMLSILGMTGFCLYFAIKENQLVMYIPAVILIITFGLLVYFIYILLKKIRLVILLFQETLKVIFDMPLIFFLPLVSAVIEIGIFILDVVIICCMFSSGNFVENLNTTETVNDAKKLMFEQHSNVKWEINVDKGMLYPLLVYQQFITLWFEKFIIDCKKMIISGTIAAWYFSRNKKLLVSPIQKSFYITVKFHLGSIAFGSLILTIVAFLRGIVEDRGKDDKIGLLIKALVSCCLKLIEEFLEFLTENAYIEQALHGQPFFKSGKRAAKILVNNLENVIIIRVFCIYAIRLVQLLIILISTGITYGIYSNINLPIIAVMLLSLLINTIIVSVAFGIIEITTDTIFICFCEDTLMNDGSTSKPYFMSRELKQFVEASKALNQPPS